MYVYLLNNYTTRTKNTKPERRGHKVIKIYFKFRDVLLFVNAPKYLF